MQIQLPSATYDSKASNATADVSDTPIKPGSTGNTVWGFLSTLPNRLTTKHRASKVLRRAVKRSNANGLDVTEELRATLMLGPADVNEISAGGHTALDHANAIQNKVMRERTVNTLKDFGALTAEQLERNRRLRDAVRAGNVEEARALVGQGADPCSTVKAQSSLSIAIASGRLDLVEALLPSDRPDGIKHIKSARARMSEQEKAAFGHDFRALCRAGKLTEARELHELGLVDVHAKSKNGRTALHDTTNTEVIRWLLGNGADVNACDNDDRTPIQSAIYSTIHFPYKESKDVLEAVKLLISGDNLRKHDKNGYLPIHYAAQGYDAHAGELMQLLLDHDPNLWKVQANNNKHQAPLQKIKRDRMNSGRFDVMARLLQARARDQSVKRWLRLRTPAFLVKEGNIKHMLPSDRARIEKEGGGRIHLCAYANDVNGLERERRLNCDFKVRTLPGKEGKEGKDVLDYAIESDSAEAFGWLMSHVYTNMSDQEWARRMQAATKVKNIDDQRKILDVFSLMQWWHVRHKKSIWSGIVAPAENERRPGRRSSAA
ncbi:ankyrin repeat domain-containing protein [Paraburkholderia sp. CI3]|uniref:ankyrin repeat domain-containing protein n=1 Tax=Paraburkholderia sp. CI3 TaxID=2991060 RepID=UPI003D1A4EEF